MIEGERHPVSPEEKFAAQVEARSATWQEMIDESSLSDEDKQGAKKLIANFRKEKIEQYNEVQDCVFHLVRNLLDIFARYEDEENRAIMDNLKKDIWDFSYELNKD